MRLRCVVPCLALLFAVACRGTNEPPPPALLVAGPPPTEFSQVDLTPGSGTEASKFARLTVNYTGWLYDASKPESKGPVFDTSLGREPFSFNLGNGEVIDGWDQGFNGMRIGGKRRLIIPPALGYGADGTGPIPPNAGLIFEMELLDVKK